MAIVLVDEDEIFRVRIVELVELIGIGQYGHIPFEQIDEYALARLEHGAEHGVGRRGSGFFQELLHDDHLIIGRLAAKEQTGFGGKIPRTGDGPSANS